MHRSPPQAQRPSSAAILKRSDPQAERSSSEAILKRSDHFPELISEVLARGHDVRFRAPGRSMYPAIREGETITVRPVSPLSVKKGDIILYRWQHGVIAHRVVGIENTGSGDLRFILRGDASGARAERVAPDQVLGRVIAADRDGRRIDLYSIPSTVRRILRPLASRLKQWALRHSTHRP